MATEKPAKIVLVMAELSPGISINQVRPDHGQATEVTVTGLLFGSIFAHPAPFRGKTPDRSRSELARAIPPD